MQTPLTLGLLAALQLLFALAGQLIVLRIVGIGWQTDAYVAAQAVPMLLTAVVAASLQSLWLPRFARAAENASVWIAELGMAQGQILKVMLSLALPLGASSSLWSPLFYPGFSGDQHELVVQIVAPLFAAAGFNALAGIITAALRAREKYILPEALSLLASIVTLGGIVIMVPHYGVTAAAWLSAARGFLVLLGLLTAAHWPRFRLSASKESREVAVQARPLIGGGVFIKSSPLVDRYWGSQGGGGEITILSIAQLAMTALATVLERALLVQAIPSFAKRLQNGGKAELKLAYRACLRRILLAVLTLGAGLVAARPIWDVLCAQFLRMSPESAWQFWLICLSLLPSLFVSIAGSAAVAVFYTFGETRLPTIIGIVGFAASLVMKGLLFLHLGIIGIAIGSSAYLMLNMMLYHVAVNRRLAECAPRPPSKMHS